MIYRVPPTSDHRYFSAVDAGIASQLTDLLSSNADKVAVDIASSNISDRLDATVDLQRLRPDLHDFTPSESPRKAPLLPGSCLTASSLTKSRSRDDSDVGVEGSRVVDDLRRTL